MRLWNNCSGEWRHMIAVTMKTTTKRLIIHEAESTHKYRHKYPLEIHSTRKKNWNKRLTKHLGNLKKTLVKLQVISRWPRARQSRGRVRRLLINKGVSPLVRIPAVTLPDENGDTHSSVITLAEREVKDSRRSGIYQSCIFWQDWASKVCRFSVLFGYLTKWEPN